MYTFLEKAEQQEKAAKMEYKETINEYAFVPDGAADGTGAFGEHVGTE